MSPAADLPLAAALLRSARTEAGLTQEQLAEAAGLSVRTVRGLESGRVTNPHRHSVQAVDAALGPDVGAAAHLRSQFAGHNCRERSSAILPRPHLIPVDLAFDPPPAAGSTHVYSHHWNVADSYAGPRTPDDPGSLSAVHGFRRPLHSYVLEVRFERCRVPDRIWQVEGPAENRRVVGPLSIGADGSAHVAYRGLAPGVCGIGWQWDGSTA